MDSKTGWIIGGIAVVVGVGLYLGFRKSRSIGGLDVPSLKVGDRMDDELLAQVNKVRAIEEEFYSLMSSADHKKCDAVRERLGQEHLNLHKMLVKRQGR